MRALTEYILQCSICPQTVVAGSLRTGKVIVCKDCLRKKWNDVKMTLFCPICKKTREVKGRNRLKSKIKNCKECSLKYTTSKYKQRGVLR